MKSTSYRQSPSNRRAFYGDRLKAMRVAKGLSQVQLGALMGVTGTQVSRVESGARACDLDFLLMASLILAEDAVIDDWRRARQ